jgi:hypothetical protein
MEGEMDREKEKIERGKGREERREKRGGKSAVDTQGGTHRCC